MKRDKSPASVIDPVANTLTIAGVVYKLDDVPFHVKDHLALFGLRHEIQKGLSFDKIVAGELRRPRARTTPTSFWPKAMELALIERSKKVGTPIAPDAAAATVSALSKEARAEWRNDPLVRKHHARLSGVADRPSALDAVLAPTSVSQAA